MCFALYTKSKEQRNKGLQIFYRKIGICKNMLKGHLKIFLNQSSIRYSSVKKLQLSVQTRFHVEPFYRENWIISHKNRQTDELRPVRDNNRTLSRSKNLPQHIPNAYFFNTCVFVHLHFCYLSIYPS